ncbi:ATP-binding response regulator [Roseateles violae]|uniref:histidine kinase n=1 Tax=Roseateles violae TaxID=3058042 RepID=A0ABT8DNU8_9BURK|nr:hybrid sensor histidine kinase/response regulator [Pelomonas sp. PFR6]MDN3920035.1 hybrid sensor histidine kinase/response regulator [Pelomonas sp. PFR6]
MIDAAASAKPIAWAGILMLLGCEFTVLGSDPWRAAAMLVGIGLAGTWSLAAWPPHRFGLDRVLRRRLATGSALALIVALALPPWLPPSPGDRSVAEVALLMIAAATASFGLSATLAPLRLPALCAALLPLSPVLAFPNLGGDFAVLALAASMLAALAALLALAQQRLWHRHARQLLDQEARHAALEAARDAAENADQEKSRFLAIASHDLRQPVHALGLFAATLEKRLQGSADEPVVRNVVQAIDGLDRSFYAMLDISRLDAGTVAPNFQHFPLRDLFRRLHMHFAGQAEMAGLHLRFAPGGKSVTSDPQLLERILGNLIQNAIKYTEHGGIVVVARSTASDFNVEVWDTGVGIAATELPRVFDEFYQSGRGRGRRHQGLGMGLAIVKRLASLLGHSLAVSSEPGRGTMFRIGIAKGILPDIQDVTAAADTVPMPALQARTVLVVDDEEAICHGLSMLLREWGYEVLTAANVEQACRQLRQLEFPPDLILSDLHLGEGPDGIAVIDAVRRECAYEVPAILITGDTTHEEMRRAADSGHLVLFKPVQPHKLLNVMRGLVS